MHFKPKRAQAVAVATPCWPAPVSAMMRVLPMRRASRIWPEHVVDLVGAGVVQVLALEVDLGAAWLARGLGARAQMRGKALGMVERAGATDVMGQQRVELGLERRIGLRRLVLALELEDQRHQRLGDEATAEEAEPAALVRAEPEGIGNVDGHLTVPFALPVSLADRQGHRQTRRRQTPARETPRARGRLTDRGALVM